MNTKPNDNSVFGSGGKRSAGRNGGTLFADAHDRALADILSPLRETVVADDGFSDRVMNSLPRRDISLWVVLAGVMAGLGVAVAVMGWTQAVAVCQGLVDFFTSLSAGQAPSLLSLLSMAALVTVLGISFYAFLDTDDYSCVDCPNGPMPAGGR